MKFITFGYGEEQVPPLPPTPGEKKSTLLKLGIGAAIAVATFVGLSFTADVVEESAIEDLRRREAIQTGKKFGLNRNDVLRFLEQKEIERKTIARPAR